MLHTTMIRSEKRANSCRHTVSTRQWMIFQFNVCGHKSWELFRKQLKQSTLYKTSDTEKSAQAAADKHMRFD